MLSNIILYIITKNKTTNQYEVVSLNEIEFIPPSNEIIPNTDIKQNCFNIYRKYIDIHEDVFTCIYLDCCITQNVDLIYFMMLPFSFTTKNIYFIPIKNIKNELHIKNLQKIINIV